MFREANSSDADNSRVMHAASENQIQQQNDDERNSHQPQKDRRHVYLLGHLSRETRALHFCSVTSGPHATVAWSRSVVVNPLFEDGLDRRSSVGVDGSPVSIILWIDL